MNDTPVSTIAALSTALGGGLSVIRLSGPAAVPVAAAAWCGRRPLAQQPARRLCAGRVTAADGSTIDHALAVRFAAPASYTGEDSVEFHGHGGALAARSILRRLYELGAVPAAPGEFTRRAFLNGRLDLAQAEAVADIIGAQSELALRVAERQLEGAISRRVDAVWRAAELLRSEVEARLDFPEEGIAFWPRERLLAAAGELDRDLAGLLAQRREGEVLRHGLRVVIAGPPNVGKSSLFNALLGRDRAIVTPLPGTTRDTLEESVAIRGIPVCLVDTAGLRATTDPAEQSGIERTQAFLRAADLVLWVVDASLPYAAQAPTGLPAGVPVVVAANKADLLPATAGPVAPGGVLTVALTGAGLEELAARIERVVWQHPPAGDEVPVAERHAQHLEAARRELAELPGLLAAERWDVAAVSLRGAAAELGRITGKTHSPDILETIFARFCIGK